MGATLKKKLELMVSLKGAASVIKGIKNISEGIFFIGNAAKMVGQALMGMLSPLNKFIKAGIQNNITLEKMGLTLEVVMKSAKKAKDLFGWVRNFAAGVPFELKNVMDAAVTMETYGLNAKKWMGNIANMAAVMGADINTATQAVANLLQGEGEMMKRFGATRQTLMQYGWSGMYADVQQLANATVRFMEDRFAQGTEKMRDTWGGLMSMFSDKWFSFTSGATSEFFERMKGAMIKVDSFLSQYDWEQIGRNMVANWREIVQTMGRILELAIQHSWENTIDWLKATGMEMTWGWIQMVVKGVTWMMNPVNWVKASAKMGFSVWKTILFGKDADKGEPEQIVKSYSDKVLDEVTGLMEKLKAIKKTGEAGAEGGLFSGAAGKKMAGGMWSEGGGAMRGAIEPIITNLQGQLMGENGVFIREAIQPIVRNLETMQKEKAWQESIFGTPFWDGFREHLTDNLNYGAQAFTAMFDVIAINANSAEKKILNVATATVSAVPKIMDFVGRIGQIGGLAGGLGIAGVGLGLIGSLISNFASRDKEDAAAEQARQDRQARKYSTVSRGTPQNITISPIVSIQGEIINLGETGDVAAQKITAMLMKAQREAGDTGQLSLGMAMGAT